MSGRADTTLLLCSGIPLQCDMERIQQSEEEDDGENTSSSSQEFDDAGLREEKALSDSEIKVPAAPVTERTLLLHTVQSEALEMFPCFFQFFAHCCRWHKNTRNEGKCRPFEFGKLYPNPRTT